MTNIGISQTQLDEIELRLAGADHRPWIVDRQLFDEAGRPLICKGSRKSRTKAEWKSIAWDDSSPENPRRSESIANAAAMKGADPLNSSTPGQPPNVIDHRTYIKALALFKLCDEATPDMADFVANAPNDIETLLNEVKFLRHRYREAEKERDEFKKEMLSLRVERSKLQENFSETRRVLRDLGRVIKECGGAQ